MEKSPRPEDFYHCKLKKKKKKKAFAEIHLLGKAIKVICEVTFNLLQTTPHSSCQEFDWQFLFIYILLYNICINAVNFSDWNFTVSAWIFIDHKIICTTCYIQGRENGWQGNHLTGFGYLCPGSRRRSDDVFMALCINQEPAFWMAFLPYPQSLLWNISKSLALVYGNSIWTPQQLASFAAPHYWKIPPSQWNLVFSQLFTKTAYEERI